MEHYAEATIKSGERLAVRSLTRRDAQAVLWVMHQCMGESKNLSRYPDEMRYTVAQETEFIKNANESPCGVLLGAFLGGELVGICSALPVAPNIRYRHRAALGMMIVRRHWGKGVGSAMMRALLDVMKKTPVEQIELDVVKTNEQAIALYTKAGFEPYGLLARGMKYRDGSYADLLMMRLDLTAQR